MKPRTFFALLMVISCLSASAQYDAGGLQKLNWKLSCQAYTFNRFTLTEALDKMTEMGIKYAEIYPGQRISSQSDETTHFSGGQERARKIKELLQSRNIQVLSYGVVSAGNESEWIQLFEFAKELGIQVIISEPPYHLLDLVESLADKYNIRVALHNHPTPTPYWDPEITLAKLKGRSSKLGVCADIGHFVRSGISPVEAIRNLRNRIFCFHMKDINQFGQRDAHDIPWGTGLCNIPGVLDVARTLGRDASLFFTIEYEYNWENSQPEVKESVDYFHRLTHWMTADY